MLLATQNCLRPKSASLSHISKWFIVHAPKSLKPIDFWNSFEVTSWIFKRTFLNFSFFYLLNFDFAFPTSVSWYLWRDDLTWSCKDFEIGNIWHLLNVECFDHKWLSNDSFTLGILSLFYRKNWLFHVEEQILITIVRAV